MSDYTKAKDARWSGKALQSILSVILALTMAFAFSGLSATQLAYAADTYDITYDLDGGTIAEDSNPATYTDKDSDFKLVNPTRDGYDFSGWTGTGLDSPTSEVTIETGSTGNREYTATWTPITYGIEYTLGDNAVPGTPANPTTYTIESDDITLSNPSRSGYVFAGWTGTDLSEPTMDVTIPKGKTGNREYTATWTQTFIVTFNADNGSANTTQTVENGKFATKPADPTKNGYTFKEWTYNGSAYGFNTPVTSDITLVATWTEDTSVTEYTVTFNTDGGTEVESQKVAENDKATKPADPTKKGYKFDCWMNGDEEYDFDTPVTGPITLTAKWVESEATYTVTYNLAGGVSTAEHLSFSDLAEGENTPTIANPTREGYTFKGWNPTVAATVTADVTYTAQWEAIGGSWKFSGGRWWYEYSDGTFPKNAWLDVSGKYYHFDNAGWMQTGWLQIDMNIENQKLAGKEWFFLDSTGAMTTSWQRISSKWYYMVTASDPQNADGLNQTGIMVAGTTKNINGEIYSFATSGAMNTGWQSSGEGSAKVWFYYDTASGAQVTEDWIKSGSSWYWMSEDGTMATSTWVDGNNYYVNQNGVMLTGWQKIGENWYCLNASGKKIVNGWVKAGNAWYWLNSGGSMAINAWVDEGNYYVNADGVMLTGWNRIGTNSLGEATLDSVGDHAYYYFNASGKKVVNGWIKAGSDWYWMGANGTMAENSWAGTNKDYYVGAKGVMVTGTERIQYDSEGTETLDKQGRWATYYFNDTGKVASNQWVKMDDKWYWFGENGYMIQGAWVDGNKYYVNDEGVYIPNYREDPTADDEK